MKKLILIVFIIISFNTYLRSQSVYLEKERFAFGAGLSTSILENSSIHSVGLNISFKKKVDLSIQYSSITLEVPDNENRINGEGVSGSFSLWGKKPQNDSPLEVALSILASYSSYEDFSTSSFGTGIIAAYKKTEPHTFNVIPMIAVSFIPFNQISSGHRTTLADEKIFSFQFGLGIYTNIFKTSKFTIEPTVFLDTSNQIGASISTSIIF